MAIWQGAKLVIQKFCHQVKTVRLIVELIRVSSSKRSTNTQFKNAVLALYDL